MTVSTNATEIHTRQQTKLVLKFLQNGETEKAQQIILKNKDILLYNFGLINFVPLIPRIRFSKVIPKKNDALKMVIDTGFRIFMEEDNVDELLFFAAAKCDIEKLNYCIDSILQKNPDRINQVREGDTALMFLIKYGNTADDKYPECMKTLINSGIDVNRDDYFSHNPILFVANLYKTYINRPVKDEIVIRNLKECIKMLLETKTIDITSLKVKTTDMTAKDLPTTFQFTSLEYHEETTSEGQEEDKLFKFLINNDEESFIKSKSVLKFLDADDGNNTFLQLCCEKNLKNSAKFLIKNGVDVCKTTERNPMTPLELAARRNHPEIFEAILKTNKVVVDEPLFSTFLRGRPKHIKAKYFDEILKYKHLDVNLRSNNGNTPLHYAIIFSSAEAIQVLLRRGASLTIENDSKTCPLDYISAEDLENHLNKCIVADTYNHINNGKYEVALNYRNLIETDNTCVISELSVVQKISKSPRLCHLLNHPLISSFINIKWKLVEPIYQYFSIFHIMFYTVSLLSFINLNLLNYLALPLAFMYSVRIWLIFKWNNNKLHEIIDTSIATIIFLSFFISNNTLKYHLALTATIFIAFSFHLFWRFNPDFSQFHALLIHIFSHLLSYLFYFSSLTLCFGAAFRIFYLIRYEDRIDNYSNIFFNEVKAMSPHFYLFGIFGVFVSVMVVMTVVSSVTYLQQNSENIRNSFQVLGYKNTLIFLSDIEALYKTKGIVRNPFIFEGKILKNRDENISLEDFNRKEQRKAKKTKNPFLVNFYLNCNRFSFEKLLSINLTNINVLRMKKVLNC